MVQTTVRELVVNKDVPEERTGHIIRTFKHNDRLYGLKHYLHDDSRTVVFYDEEYLNPELIRFNSSCYVFSIGKTGELDNLLGHIGYGDTKNGQYQWEYRPLGKEPVKYENGDGPDYKRLEVVEVLVAKDILNTL